MTDLVNEFFRKHYPADLDRDKFEPDYVGGGYGCSYGCSYSGPGREKRIFPYMVCADGTRLSVQGHFGAYSEPRDDFADHYSLVEVMGPPDIQEFGRGEKCGDEMIYGYVRVDAVCDFIAKHGGLAP